MGGFRLVDPTGKVISTHWDPATTFASFLYKMPDPTASLSDCEPLLEEMRKAGLLVAMTTDSKGWHCGLGDDSGAIYNAKSESLTVAICLVFAKWNGAK